MDKEKLSNRPSTGCLAKEGGVWVSVTGRGSRQGQVGAGFPLPRREGGRHHGHLGCRSGPILHWAPSSQLSGPASPSPCLPLDCLLLLLPCPFQSILHSAARVHSYKTAPAAQKSSNGCPPPIGERPDLFLFLIASLLFSKNRAEIKSFLTLNTALTFHKSMSQTAGKGYI